MPNRLHELAVKSANERAEVRTVVVDGTEYRFRSERGGDDYFAVVAYDPSDARRKGKHYATDNGRSEPYDEDLWPDVVAITRTYVAEEGEEELQPSTVFALFDSNPAAFAACRNAALAAIGLGDSWGSASGYISWDGVFRALARMSRALVDGKVDDAKAAVKVATSIAARALQEYKSEPEAFADLPDEDRDVIIEGALKLGNEEAPAS